MKNMFALVFQENGLRTVVLSSLILQGPSSMNNPITEEAPGPNYSLREEPFCCGWRLRTAICPEYYIILVWVAAAFEEVKERMTSTYVYVACI